MSTILTWRLRVMAPLLDAVSRVSTRIIRWPAQTATEVLVPSSALELRWIGEILCSPTTRHVADETGFQWDGPPGEAPCPKPRRRCPSWLSTYGRSGPQGPDPGHLSQSDRHATDALGSGFPRPGSLVFWSVERGYDVEPSGQALPVTGFG